jgi:hypothetical protein
MWKVTRVSRKQHGRRIVSVSINPWLVRVRGIERRTMLRIDAELLRDWNELPL